MLGDLPPKFERDALHGVGRHLNDLFAHSGAAGEGDLVDVGMLNQRRPGGLTESGDDVDHAVGKSAGLELFGEFENGERGLLGGLEYAGATGG